MKFVVIGFGQCGGRLADEFARLNSTARSARGIEIVPCAVAVNTDTADLTGLKHISKDYQHRILIGGRKTGGHGVGKINELGAEVAEEDSDKIIDAIRSERRALEADAFLLTASTGGGTGSGAVAVMTKILRDRYGDKPIYTLLVLPFDHEESTEERTVNNTATCLKTCYSIADATILVDNQRYVSKDASIIHNLGKINHQIVTPFYDLLCAGEEKKAKFVGSKTLDAGDIIQTLKGWTVLGYGTAHLPKFKLPFLTKTDFRSKNLRTLEGIQAMDEAMSELSLKCDPADAGRIIYLMSAPAKEMSLNLAKELGDYVRSKAPNAVIRNGDYPRDRDTLNIHIVLSELADLAKIRHYYTRSVNLIPEMQRRKEANEKRLKNLEEMGTGIPSLLDKK